MCEHSLDGDRKGDRWIRPQMPPSSMISSDDHICLWKQFKWKQIRRHMKTPTTITLKEQFRWGYFSVNIIKIETEKLEQDTNGVTPKTTTFKVRCRWAYFLWTQFRLKQRRRWMEWAPKLHRPLRSVHMAIFVCEHNAERHREDREGHRRS